MLRRIAILLLLAGAWFAAPAAATPMAPEKLTLSVRGFVADDAGVLSANFRREMKERLERIQDQAGVTVLLVSTSGIEGMDSQAIAKTLGQTMEAVGKAKRFWVVFLLNPVNREYAAAFSGVAQLPEGTDPNEAIASIDKQQFVQRIIDAFEGPVTPYFKADDWEGGMRAGVEAIERHLVNDGQLLAPPPGETPVEEGPGT